MIQRRVGQTPTRQQNVAQKPDDQPQTGLLMAVDAVGAESLSKGVGGTAIVQTDAGSQIGGKQPAVINWSCSPPSTRRSSSFEPQ